MAAPTLEELFGTNATNDGATLSISIADLVSVGLDSGASYTPVKIAAALVKLWHSSTSDKIDDPTVGLVIGDPFLSLYTRGDDLQRVYQYPCSFYVPDAGEALDPDLVV